MTNTEKRHRVAVYKQDGTSHCGIGKAIPLDAMFDELRGLGVSPQFPQKRLLPGQANKLGGASTGCCNVFEIFEDEYDLHAAYIEEAGFRLWPEKEDAVSHLYGDPDQLEDDDLDADFPGDIHNMPIPASDRYIDAGPFQEGQLNPSSSMPQTVLVSDLLGKSVQLHSNAPDFVAQGFDANRVNIQIDPVTRHISGIWLG